jgi:hypothetical protein
MANLKMVQFILIRPIQALSENGYRGEQLFAINNTQILNLKINTLFITGGLQHLKTLHHLLLSLPYFALDNFNVSFPQLTRFML